MTRLAAIAWVMLALLPAPASGEGSKADGAVPRLEHVFVIIEENMNFDDVVNHATEAPYLSALAQDHVRHEAYYGLTHASLGNYTGMVSGQIPSSLDQRNCPGYTDCIRAGPTIAAQLDSKGLTWRGYFESMPRPCARPSGGLDGYQVGYATRHNPFVYFQEIVGNEPYCLAHVVPYEKNFEADLKSGPPNFAFIVPNTCNDGHDTGCQVNKTPLQVLDAWLEKNAPPILKFVYQNPRSALIVTFDEAVTSDRSACCNQKPGAGGGHIDFVMVAPGLERARGHRPTTPANHYSLLRTLEEAFGLAPLGEAVSVPPMTDLFKPPPAR